MKKEQKIEHQIVLDIETTGLNPWYGDKITCICAKDIDTEDKFTICSDDERDIIFKFMEWMYKYSVQDTMIITANGTQFDIPFILTRLSLCPVNDWNPEKLLNFAHFDVDNDITKKRISLNDIASILSLEQKTSNGLQAIQWFQEKKYDDIKEYCWHDVLLTEKVYLTFRMVKNAVLSNSSSAKAESFNKGPKYYST